MSDANSRDELRRLAEGGDSDAIDQLVELAGEEGDVAELRRLADQGSRDAVDELVQLAIDSRRPRRTPPAGSIWEPRRR